MPYPLRFQPVYKEKIWGASRLHDEFGKNADASKKIGESWEVSAVPKSESVVLNGALKGKRLSEVVKEYTKDLLGEYAYKKFGAAFPLLVKFIDANANLSVQAHPDDAYARAKNMGFGKTEIWFVLSAAPNAKIIAGFSKPTTREEIENAIQTNTLSDFLHYLPVKEGDAVLIPAGRVHALLEGVVIAEIQQTSDITFRLYDWGRRADDGAPRELNVKEALDVINFNDTQARGIGKYFVEKNGMKIADVIRDEFFSIDEIETLRPDNAYDGETVPERSFEILIALEGEGVLEYGGGKEAFRKGDTLLLPANLGEYYAKGALRFLRVFV